MSNPAPSEVVTDAIPAEIRSFLERLLADAGFAVEGQEKERLIAGLFQKLDGYIIDTVVDNLPAEKIDEFTAFIQKQPSRDELNDYLGRTLPNAQDVFVSAFAGFREAYLAAVAVSRQSRA